MTIKSRIKIPLYTAVIACISLSLSVNVQGDEAASPPSVEYPSSSPLNDVVFSSSFKSRFSTLWILNRDSGEIRKLIDWSDSVQTQPVWTTDGKYIVFVSKKNSGKGNIWRVNADGSNPVQLTSSGDNRFPQITHDGRWVFYKTKRSGRTEYRYVSLDGLTEKKAKIPKGITNPIFSPDGDSVAYRKCNSLSDLDSYDRRICNIYKYSFQTGKSLQLTYSDDNYSDIAWGKNGIVFASNFAEQPSLWIIDEYGNNPRQLLKGNCFCTTPTWSASGETVIFSKTDSQSTNLWEVDLYGEQTRLTNIKDLHD